MDVFVDQKALAEEMGAASMVVQSSGTQQILRMVLLEAQDGVLRSTSTDSDMLRIGTIQAEVAIGGNGPACVDAKAFAAMVRELPAGRIRLSTRREKGYHRLCIEAGRTEFKAPGIDPMEFASFPHFVSRTHLAIPQDSLRRLVEQTAFALSKQAGAGIAGAAMEVHGSPVDRLRIIATDGVRLSLSEAACTGDATPPEAATIPKAALSVIRRAIVDSPETVRLEFGDEGFLRLVLPNENIVFRLIVESPPDYNAFMNPKDVAVTVTFDRDALAETLHRMEILANPKATFTLGLLADRRVQISTLSAERGSAEELLPTELASFDNDSTASFDFRLKHLREIVSASRSERLILRIVSEKKPAVVEDGEFAKFVLMPTPRY